jgi:protein-tyrosine phosphatase
MTSVSAPSQYKHQLLPVKGIVNARDLGGYEVSGGYRIKLGMLFRTAHLAGARTADLAYLESLSIGLVVDFRVDREKQGKLDQAIPGARCLDLPIDAGGAMSAKATEEEKRKILGKKGFNVKKIIVAAAFNEKAKTIAREMYPTIFFYPDCQRQMAAFLRLVVEEGDKPILFHCTQGKDRTGIASALLLAALGADRKTIVTDFDMTNQVYEKDVRKYTRRVRFWGGKEEEVAVVKAFMGANTENFIKALDAVDAQYGSLEAYLKGPMGLTDADIQTLRTRYLEK